jgi:hypothetical protein
MSILERTRTMLKKFSIFIILAALLLPAGIGFAQDGDQIAIGEEVSGEITNANYDQEYLFEGTEGDVVVITLTRDLNADFDPLLYLTTVENEILAQNDDFSDLNSRIIFRLPATQTYQVVATRLSERSGYGEGTYTLLVEQAQTFSSGTVVEGTVSAAETAPGHIFVPETAGIYTITYNMVRGDYFPTLTIHRLVEDSTYSEEIARLSASTLHGGSLTIEIELDAIYVISFESSYYGEALGSAVYTITVDQVTPE